MLSVCVCVCVSRSNGVDNGKLWFDHVRIPREMLLDAISQVSDEATGTSIRPSTSRKKRPARFMLPATTLWCCSGLPSSHDLRARVTQVARLV